MGFRKQPCSNEVFAQRVLEGIEKLDAKLAELKRDVGEIDWKLTTVREAQDEQKTELRDIRTRLFSDEDGVQGRLGKLGEKFGQHVIDDARMQRFLIVGFGIILSLQLDKQLSWIDKILSAAKALAQP